VPREVLTREILEAVFQWPVETVEWDGVPQIIPLRAQNAERRTHRNEER
jgi:hypothetical protein